MMGSGPVALRRKRDRLLGRALDRVARVEEQRRAPFRPNLPCGGRDPGQTLAEVLVRERVLRVNAAVQVRGVEDRQRDRRRRAERRARGDEKAEGAERTMNDAREMRRFMKAPTLYNAAA